MREFDSKTLSEHNGQENKPVYIAHNGKVYDVTGSKMWKTGTHMKRHAAGVDLSADISAAPHGSEVLERYPQIGTLIQSKAESDALPVWLENLLDTIPFLRRHPHPIAVHFPVVFMISPVIFSIIYLITGTASFETTAFHCLGAGITMLVPAILTGIFAWWVNYQAKAMRPVIIKIILTIVLCILGVAAFIWRLFNPELLKTLDTSGKFYLLLLFSLMPIVSIIGFFGGTLTFPHAKPSKKAG